MRRNPDDPFEDLFKQLEQFVEDMMEQGGFGPGTVPGGGQPSGDTHVDVHEYDERITVIADLPGVEKSDIELSCDGSILSIQAENDNRRYDERVQLPGQVDAESARAKYNNGVLEIRFDRAGDSASIDVE